MFGRAKAGRYMVSSLRIGVSHFSTFPEFITQKNTHTLVSSFFEHRVRVPQKNNIAVSHRVTYSAGYIFAQFSITPVPCCFYSLPTPLCSQHLKILFLCKRRMGLEQCCIQSTVMSERMLQMGLSENRVYSQ